MELEEGLLRRLYSKEVAGHGPEPRGRGGAMMKAHATQGRQGQGPGTDQSKLNPLLPNPGLI